MEKQTGVYDRITGNVEYSDNIGLSESGLRYIALIARYSAQNKDVAVSFDRSLQTIKNVLRYTYAYLGVTNRTGASLWYERQSSEFRMKIENHTSFIEACQKFESFCKPYKPYQVNQTASDVVQEADQIAAVKSGESLTVKK